MKEKSVQEDRVSGFLGQSFVRIPRKVLAMVFHGKGQEKTVGLVYLMLLSEVYFAEGRVVLQKRSYICKRGEYMGTCKALSEGIGMSMASVRRGLKWLKEEGLIEISPLEDGCRIRVCGYHGMMAVRPAESLGKGGKPVDFSSFEEAERNMGGRSMQFDLNAGEAERGEA